MTAVETSAFPTTDVSHHGRAVTAIGEDGDMGVMAEGHGIGALRAINAFQRDLLGPNWHNREFSGLKAEEVWIVVDTACGCTPEQHKSDHRTEDGYDLCDCEHVGLPPCSDEYEWTFVFATETTPGAVPATEVLW